MRRRQIGFEGGTGQGAQPPRIGRERGTGQMVEVGRSLTALPVVRRLRYECPGRFRQAGGNGGLARRPQIEPYDLGGALRASSDGLGYERVRVAVPCSFGWYFQGKMRS